MLLPCAAQHSRLPEVGLSVWDPFLLRKLCVILFWEGKCRHPFLDSTWSRPQALSGSLQSICNASVQGDKTAEGSCAWVIWSKLQQSA